MVALDTRASGTEPRTLVSRATTSSSTAGNSADQAATADAARPGEPQLAATSSATSARHRSSVIRPVIAGSSRATGRRRGERGTDDERRCDRHRVRCRLPLGTSTSSPAYNNLVAELKTHGLTIGPGADVNVQTVGSISAQVAGLKTGRLAAAASTPPSIPVIPNTTVINLGRITPLSQSVGQYLCVADSFAAAHPKTVQAVVTAITQAWNYARRHPAQAEKLISSLDKVNGVTDPAEVHTLFADSSGYWRTPVMARTGFTSAVYTVNLAQQQGLTLSYNDFADPKYVNAAVRQLHLQVPAG